MDAAPAFPEFKPLELADKPIFDAALAAHPPRTSELGFTNLFIWRRSLQTRWCRLDDWLLVVFGGASGGACGLEPIGPPGRADAVDRLLGWLAADCGSPDPRLERVGSGLADELAGDARFAQEATREHFDYVYRRSDLVELRGKRYHAKRNHINRLRREREYAVATLGPALLDECLELAELWCHARTCTEDMGLNDEWEATRELLQHFEPLALQGAVIQIDDRVQAFTAADRLRPDTSVVHVEKANPEIPQLYAAINQHFAERLDPALAWINREQDLGEPGLRKAKQSYHPDHLEPKFRIRPQRGSSAATKNRAVLLRNFAGREDSRGW